MEAVARKEVVIPSKRSGLTARDKATIGRNNLVDQWRETRSGNNELIRRKVLNGDLGTLMKDVLGYNYDTFQATAFALQRSTKKNLILAPRGFGKSTALTVAVIVLEVLMNPNIRILIGSKSDKQARGFLDEAKQCLQKERLIEIFGIQGGEKITVWNEDAINVLGRTIAAKEKTVTALGSGGSVTSRHFDLIIADDLVDNKNSRTTLQRRELHKFFYQTLRPCLEPKGRMYVLGTRYHPDDLYNWLMTKDPEFNITTFIIPALVDGESQYPERYETEELLSLRTSMGTIFFDSQLMLNTDSMRGEIFKYDYFKWYSKLPPRLRIFAAADLALGKKTQHDFFAIVVLGYDDNENIFILDTYAGKISLEQQNKMILHYHEKHDPILFGIEANAYQGAKIEELKKTPEGKHVRAVPIFTREDKVTRAQKFAVYYERGEVYHPEHGVEGLEDQLCSFPNGDHDDLFDAEEMAASLRWRGRRKPRKEPGVIG